MPAVPNIRTRLRALLLVVVLLALGAGTTAAKSGARVPLDGAPDQAAADVLHVARNQLGDPYVWGGNGPDGWDCSGLTSLWRTVGGADDMPRVSREQQAWAVPVPREQLQRGDLVFFGHPVTHVGIVSGGGYMIDAGASRSRVVQRLIWSTGVVRYGRVPRPGMPPVKPWTPPPLPPLDLDAPVADQPVAAPRTTKPTTTTRTTPTTTTTTKPTTTTPTTTTPPTTKPAPARSAKPSPAPKRTTEPAPAPKRATTPATTTTGTGLPPLPGLPGVQARPSSRIALKAATNAKSVRGSPHWDDVSLVRTAWKHAGGGVLPASRTALVAKGTVVPLLDARVGDLVVYNSPATHVGVYLGHGYMVDASKTMGRVVVRRVYAAPSVRLIRLG